METSPETMFDCTQVGTNMVTLTVTDGTNTVTTNCEVNVQDNLAPAFTPSEIANETLTTEDGATCPAAAMTNLIDGPVAAGSTFTIAGLMRDAPELTDNCAANTTLSVMVTTTTTDCSTTIALEWTAADDNGNGGMNTTSVTQTYTIEDNTIPLITVTGGDEEVCEDGMYTDMGATATDNCFGDISGDIVVTYEFTAPGATMATTIGGVDETIPGTYTVIYNVSDVCGNMADEQTRTVEVRGKPTTNPMPLSICIGTTETIMSNAVAGPNDESGDFSGTYKWTYGGGSASGFTINGAFVSNGQMFTTENLLIDATFANAGNAIFTLAVTDDDLGCVSDSPVFQVIFNTGVTAGTAITPNAAFCADEGNVDLFSLLDGENTGGTFSRNGGDGTGGLLTGSTFNTTGAMGTFTFSYEVTSGACGNDITNFTFTVEPEPNAGTFNASTAAICSDAADFDLLTLLDGEDADGTFLRTSGTGGTLTDNLFDPTGATPGIFTFSYTVAGDECDDDVANVSIQVDGAANVRGEPAAGYAEDDMVVDFCSDFGSIDLNNLLDGTQTGGGMFAKVDNTDPGTLIGNTFNAGNLPGSDPVTIQFTYTVMGGGACTAGTDQTTFALTVQPAPDAGSLEPNAENDVCTDNMVFDLFTLIQGEDDGGTWTELTNSGATLSGANNATLDATTATPGAGYQFAYIVPARLPARPTRVLPLRSISTKSLRRMPEPTRRSALMLQPNLMAPSVVARVWVCGPVDSGRSTIPVLQTLSILLRHLKQE